MTPADFTPSELENMEANRPPVTSLRIFLRGLAVSLPTILTIVILIWVFHGVNSNIIQPATYTVKYFLSQFVDESVPTSLLVHIDAAPPIDHCGSSYLVTSQVRDRYFKFVANQASEPTPPSDGGTPPDWNARQQAKADWMQNEASSTTSGVYVPLGPRAVPYHVFADVARSLPPGQIPQSARGVYMQYVADKYFGSVIPLSLLTILIIVAILYFMGRFVSIRVGRWLVFTFEEKFLGRLPLIRNVYGSVKQVTDFVFTENQQVEYRRVVAVEYPHHGIWTIGFVTGESMMDIALAAGEPCVSILIPTSPMPMTGFTVSVPKSRLIDLNLTVEQAMQFCISCGVLTPAHQRLTLEAIKKLNSHGTLPQQNDGSSGVDAVETGSNRGR